MQKIFLLLLCCSLLVLAGCNKEEGATTLRGIVVREDTGEPVAGVEVGIRAEFKGSSPGNYLYLDSMTTGDDGKFDLTAIYQGSDEVARYCLSLILPEGHELQSKLRGHLCDGEYACNYYPNKTYSNITLTLRLRE